MHKSDLEIGKKIRELRLIRGLTQKELAGDEITRNMLSLIENGTAVPSVQTLMYLSKRLGVPAGYFIPKNETEEKTLSKFSYYDELREAYSEGNWEKCVSLCPDSGNDDEISFIRASSLARLAVNAMNDFEISDALSKLDEADKAAGESVYCSRTFYSMISYYRTLAALLCTDDIPPSLCDGSGCSELLPFETVAYFVTLKAIRAGEALPAGVSLTGLHKAHIDALSKSLDEDYMDAIHALRNLSDNPSLPSYMLYRVLSDLENVAEVSGNIRLAYNATRRKLQIIDKCRNTSAERKNNEIH